MQRGLAPDGLFQHAIKPHSLEKIIRHDFYAGVFSTAMKNKWAQRAYIGLYCGPGRAQVEGTGEIVETSPMGAVQLTDPFTHYIFVDKDQEAITALMQRVSRARPDAKAMYIVDDVNDAVPEIKRALPRFSKDKGLICFCFVDPYAADLKFSTIRALSVYKIDFLILLMLGRDVRTNFKQYYDDTENTRIADLIDSPNWRAEWRESGEKSPVRFVLRKFNEAMSKLGYQPTRDELVHPVKIPAKNVFLYSLVFYSKHDLAQAFWRETLSRTDPQLGFGI